tara:strand:+ start:505 stop:1785 length:1281 start_codon:yes stop_codon:yes gene_type:complete
MPTITESIVREAPEVEAFKLGLLKSGKTLADVSLQLPTQQVAGLSPLEQQAIAQAGLTGGIGGYRQLAQGGRDTLGTGLGTMGSALGALGTAPGYLDESVGALGRSEQRMVQSTGQGPAALGYDAGQFQPGAGYTAQGYDPGSVAAYFNPYEDSAVQQALTDIRRQGDIASNQQNAAAVQAGAFGGSRQGLQSAELTRNILEQQGRTAAGMRQAGFQNAMQQSMAAFEEQQRRAQAESQFGTSAGQQAFEAAQRRQQAQAQFGTSSAQQLFEDQQRRQQAAALQQSGIASIYGNLAASQQALGGQYGKIGQAQANLGVQQLNAAQQAQQQGLGEFQALQQAGNLERQQTQSALNADFQNQQRQLYEPQTRLSWLSDIYKGAPSGQSSIGSKVAPEAPTPSLFQQVASAGTGLLGAYAGAKQIGKLF